jgi:hypothetical protein
MAEFLIEVPEVSGVVTGEPTEAEVRAALCEYFDLDETVVRVRTVSHPKPVFPEVPEGVDVVWAIADYIYGGRRLYITDARDLPYLSDSYRDEVADFIFDALEAAGLRVAECMEATFEFDGTEEDARIALEKIPGFRHSEEFETFMGSVDT